MNQANVVSEVDRAADLLRASQWNEAKLLLDRCLAVQPTLAIAHRLRGIAAYYLGDLERAVEDCTNAIREGDPDYVPYSYRARCRIAQHLYADAIEDFSQAIQIRIKEDDLGPDYTYAERAAARAQSGDIAGAIDDYGRAIACCEFDAIYHKARADLFRKLGDIPRALADYDVAVDNAPNRFDGRLRRGELLAAIGKFADAVEDYTAVLGFELPPETAVGVYCRRAEAEAALGRIDEAIADYDTAVAIGRDLVGCEALVAPVDEARKRLREIADG